MLAATLRRAGACRRVLAVLSRSRSGSFRIAALRRRAPTSAMRFLSSKAAAMASSSYSSSSAATSTPSSSSSSTPSPNRFPPLAPGSVDPQEYQARLDEKVERVRSILANVLPPPRRSREGDGKGTEEEQAAAPLFPLEVFASPVEGFRLRAEFRVWHDGGDVYYVMFDTRDPSIKPPPKVRIDHFPVGPPMMNALMEETLAAMREDKGEGDDDEEEEEEVLVEEEEEEEEAENGNGKQRFRKRRKKHGKSRGGPLRRKLFQANFHTTLNGECVVTLLYHRNLGDEAEGAAWTEAAQILKDRLLRAASGFGCKSVDVIGRSRGVARVVEKDHVEEVLEVEFGVRKKEEGEEENSSSSSSSFSSSFPLRRSLRYRQTEGSFSQPNGRVCQSMLGWAWRAALGDEGSSRRNDDLLELYCGNGNFTAAFAPAFRRVVATEVSRSGVASAVINLKENETEGDDVVVARADADRVAAALAALDRKGDGEEGDVVASSSGEEKPENGENENADDEEKTKEEEDVFSGVTPTSLGGNADLSTYDLRTLFVDPPRAGVGPVTERVLERFDRVLYVSCNPESLAGDVARLVNGDRGGRLGGGIDGEQPSHDGTHEITAAAVFDQFPYTDHIECGLLLERKKRKNCDN